MQLSPTGSSGQTNWEVAHTRMVLRVRIRYICGSFVLLQHTSQCMHNLEHDERLLESHAYYHTSQR
jgi:hypothetical protein